MTEEGAYSVEGVVGDGEVQGGEAIVGLSVDVRGVSGVLAKHGYHERGVMHRSEVQGRQPKITV